MTNEEKLGNFKDDTYKKFLKNKIKTRGGDYCLGILHQMDKSKLLGLMVESFYTEIKKLLIENIELKKQIKELGI